uniref:Uncharacterized protein n=1 Tax=Electrophorus electricus TaxID=8005 RepID=A0A4W4GYF4_ELEEL
MSSPVSLLSEQLFQCPVCLDIFTQPVSLPCGHTFCLSCIQTQWITTGSPHCPKCSAVFRAPPELCENSFAGEMVRKIREQRRKIPASEHVISHAERICRTHERPLELFCRYDQTFVCVLCMDTEHYSHHAITVEREWADRKVRAITIILMYIYGIYQALENTDREIAASKEVFSALVCCIERSQTEVLKVMEEKQKAAERQAEVLIRQLEMEVTKLKAKESDQQNHLVAGDWQELPKTVNILCLDFTCQISNFAVDLTLDPSTANPWLVVSPDGKHVKDGNVEQDVPNIPQRFDTAPCVLAREPLSGGCSYWEVEVANKTAWDLGVAKESVGRKGLVTLSPQDGYWAICLRRGREYRACDRESVLLSLCPQPQRISVFVNYEEGQVSFYDPLSGVHIYSFTGQCFSEKLLAFFNPDMNESGNNKAPLVIRSVSRQAPTAYDGVMI